MLKPTSVEQVLRVLELFRQNKRLGFGTAPACSRAIQQTAREHGVRYQTIGDGCRRRLGLTDMSVFHQLAEAWFVGDSKPLAAVLKSNSLRPSYARIDEFFSEKSSSAGAFNRSSTRDEEFTTIQVTMPDQDVKKLRVLAALEEKEVTVLASELLRFTTLDRLRAALA